MKKVLSYHTLCLIITPLAICVYAANADTNYITADIGVCEDVRTGRMRCAMQSSDCKPQEIDDMGLKGEKWFSAYTQKQRGQDFCSCNETSVGSCNSRCSPHQYGYCDANEMFHDATLFTHNSGCKCNTVTYGACQDLTSSMDHFCALSPHDCEGDHHHFWVEPGKAKAITGLDCRCEQVRVGGCVGKNMGFTCALSKDDCPWDVFYPPYSLKRLHGRTCNLCDSADHSLLQPDELDTIQQDPKRGLSRGNKVAIAFTVIFGIVGFSVGLFLWRRKRNGGVMGNIVSSNSSRGNGRSQIIFDVLNLTLNCCRHKGGSFTISCT